MHWFAGTILVVQVILMLLFDKTISLPWLDWAAWLTWGIGGVIIVLAISTLRGRGKIPPGESFVDTQVIVSAGIYGLVRHPLYLGWSVMHIVPFLFNPRWELGLLGLVGIATVSIFTRQEEQHLLNQFGVTYRDYMEKVPGMNILKGIMTAVRQRHVKES